MILADTSVWIDHLRHGNTSLANYLHDAMVVTHPFVIGELACANFRMRQQVLSLLSRLPTVTPVSHNEAVHFLESRSLSGKGLGWIDVHLIAAAVAARIPLLTLDRRLAAVHATLASSV
jgi:predicted nucleic acid-binding protein